MNKHILISVSPYIQKYYINEKYKDLPLEVKEDLRAKLGVLAEKTNAIISLGCYESGEVFMEYRYEDLSYTDEIGAELRVKKFQQEEEDLLNGIKRWFMLYHTANGLIVREVLLMQTQKKSSGDIIEAIIKKHGEAYREFANHLLEE